MLSSSRPWLSGKKTMLVPHDTTLVDHAATKRQHVEDSRSRICVTQRVWIRYKESDDEETSVVNSTIGSATADSVLSIGLQDSSTDCVRTVRAGNTFDVTSTGRDPSATRGRR